MKKIKHDCEIRRFLLKRNEDVSGVSGEGIVAEGVSFGDGSVALKWRTYYSSLEIWSTITELERIHGHQGKTLIIWID